MMKKITMNARRRYCVPILNLEMGNCQKIQNIAPINSPTSTNSNKTSLYIPQFPSNQNNSQMVSNRSQNNTPIICTPVITDDSMNEVISDLWLGGNIDEQELISENFTHVLSIIDKEPQYINSDTFKTKWINIEDDGHEHIDQYFSECNNFIHEGLCCNNGKVYVHCQKGLSRSPTIVIAYIMEYGICGKHYNFNDAFDYVRSKRSSICPNLGFNIALRVYENHIDDFKSPI
jgi:protein-tyrosine phosphatase